MFEFDDVDENDYYDECEDDEEGESFASLLSQQLSQEFGVPVEKYFKFGNGYLFNGWLMFFIWYPSSTFIKLTNDFEPKHKNDALAEPSYGLDYERAICKPPPVTLFGPDGILILA